MTADALYSDHWLLAYEALVKGWLPPKDGIDYVAADPFFSILKAGNVNFYDVEEPWEDGYSDYSDGDDEVWDDDEDDDADSEDETEPTPIFPGITAQTASAPSYTVPDWLRETIQPIASAATEEPEGHQG